MAAEILKERNVGHADKHRQIFKHLLNAEG